MKIKATETDGTTTTVVDTARATRHWSDAQDWDGRNWIYRSTGQQFRWESLYRSARGRYYIVSGSAWQGEHATARFVSQAEAAAWLVLNGHELPDELAEHDPTE